MEYTDYDLSKLACEKLLGIDFSKRTYEGRIDPLNDWGVLGPLMVKYKHVLDMDECFMYVKDSEIPRAIIMCILTSEDII